MTRVVSKGLTSSAESARTCLPISVAEECSLPLENARVVAARASDDSEEASEMKTRLIDAAVAALRQIRRNDQAAIEAIVGPVSVRMATPDDEPFWPVQAPEYVF